MAAAAAHLIEEPGAAARISGDRRLTPRYTALDDLEQTLVRAS